ncbi:MAG: hypothetical protein IKI06_08695 [Prevotella sp.]|nr:hypothetical protein [Prevotella sp.]
MKKIYKLFTLFAVALMGLSLTACSEDDLDTNQYKGGVSLNVYGPSPVMRGGQLRFLGSNLDQIAQVEIPGVAPITNIQVVQAGVPSEIRITVPKDGPLPGLITLVTKTNERITTKTEVNYEEGIEITSFPVSAMPGDVIKIEGDYLNLIYSIAFADNVVIGENDFVSHDRYYLEVIVPEEAKTGKLELYTADLTTIDKSKVEYQIIQTEKAIMIGSPTISALEGRDKAEPLGTITAKAGEKITVTGTYLNLAKDVTIGGVSAVDLKISNDGTGIMFTLPADAPDGDIIIVCKSGVEVPVGKLNTVKPTECVAAPNPVKAGKSLTISGKDMDLINAVEFDGTDAVTGEGITVNADKVVIKEVPEKATEGNLRLVMANGQRIEVAFTLVKPTITSYNTNPASAGSPLKITGTDLDLVKSITFGEAKNDDDKFEVSANGKTITVTVPMAATSGKPQFNLANGTSVEGAELQIKEAVFCYFTELPADDAELKAGESFVLPVANGDKLTGVEINGEACQYVITSNNQLIIGIPTTAKKGSKVRLISSNGEITYTFDFIPNTEVTTVLWTGQAVADDWKDQPYVLSDGGKELTDAGVVAGDIITFHITPLEAAWKIQFVEGHWGPTYASICSIGNDTEGGKFTEYDLDANKGNYSIEVTQAMLDAAFTQQWWGGVFVLNGDNVVIDKITTTHYNSLETTLWEGEAVADNWGGQPYILSDGGTELLAAGMKVGSIIRCYLTATDASWNCQIVDGHWNPNTPFEGCDFSSGNWNLAEHNGAIEFTVTDYIYEHITTSGGWGGSFLLNGDNVICTKVTIE